MALEGERLVVGLRIPDFERVIFRGRDDKAAIGTDRTISHTPLTVFLESALHPLFPRATLCTRSGKALQEIHHCKCTMLKGRDDKTAIGTDRKTCGARESEPQLTRLRIPDFERVIFRGRDDKAAIGTDRTTSHSTRMAVKVTKLIRVLPKERDGE